jgi:hypothetical protein
MKIFAYTTRGARTAEQTAITVDERAIVHQFRLLNEKSQVKLLGTAFFRTDKSDKSLFSFGKDAAQPLNDAEPLLLCTQIQYLNNGDWQELNIQAPKEAKEVKVSSKKVKAAKKTTKASA